MANAVTRVVQSAGIELQVTSGLPTPIQNYRTRAQAIQNQPVVAVEMVPLMVRSPLIAHQPNHTHTAFQFDPPTTRAHDTGHIFQCKQHALECCMFTTVQDETLTRRFHFEEEHSDYVNAGHTQLTIAVRQRIASRPYRTPGSTVPKCIHCGLELDPTTSITATYPTNTGRFSEKIAGIGLIEEHMARRHPELLISCPAEHSTNCQTLFLVERHQGTISLQFMALSSNRPPQIFSGTVTHAILEYLIRRHSDSTLATDAPAS